MVASDVSTRRDLVSVPGLFLLLAGAVLVPVHAQVIPGGATPGGALPKIAQATQPEEASADLIFIPKVAERPLGMDEGPRIIVQKFLHAGVVDRPVQGVSVEAVDAMLEAARQTQPAEGYTINQLQEVAGKVGEYYRRQGFILAQAFVPAQEVRSGEIMIHVLEGKLGQITVEGNRSYSAESLLRPFNALIGGPVDKDSIESALLTLTNYPGVTAFGVLGSGADVGTTNLTLRVQSEDRVELGTSMDNYGSQFAGEYRGQLGLTINNVFGAADRLAVFGLSAFDDDSTSDAQGVYGGVDYEVPLFSPRDFLRLAYATNIYDVGSQDSDLVAAGAEGETSIGELGYRHNFAPHRLGSASFGLALSVKRAEFIASDFDVFEDNLTTARLDFAWNRIDTRFRGVNRVVVSYTRGFDDLWGSIGEYDQLAPVRPSRRGANGEFDKFLVVLQRRQALSRNTAFTLRLVGQHSSDPLVSLEQFSLAGPEAVRAYPVAELLAEKGGLATVEFSVNAPGFASKPAFGGRTWGQILQFSLFADYASGELNQPLFTSQDAKFDLSGWGGAVQLDVPGRAFMRIDVATPISNREPTNGRDPQYYVRFGFTF